MTKRIKAIYFDLEKEKIFDRRRTADALRKIGISPIDIVYETTRLVDADLRETIERSKDFLKEEYKIGMDINQ